MAPAGSFVLQLMHVSQELPIGETVARPVALHMLLKAATYSRVLDCSPFIIW
jgi:hypothetical protein